MKLVNRLWVIALCGSILVFAGCYDLVFKQQDMENVRRQFHLPKRARFLSFDSYPKTPGFFGREGLRITATLEFSEELFEEYVAHLNDIEVWKPVPYLNYSPSIADEYSKEALRWSDLPLPDSIKERFRQIGFMPKGLDARHGKYYCSALLTVRGEPLENNPAAYRWRYVGRSYLELTESDFPTILAFAILDYEKKIIHVHIQFSG